ncbi:MAG: carbohydrate ABC transporter permease [Lachnospiraceae bacterium]|nr:carbohydrate ABC transporter permease [Lachnospiraceae bacterium]
MTKMSRKERRQKAQEVAGISFWVDLRKGRLSKYAIQKKIRGFITLLFRYLILGCLSFIILSSLWSLIKDAITDPNVLSDKSSVWVPSQISSIFLEMAWSKSIMNYLPSLAYTMFTTLILTILQVVSAGLAAYAFARMKFKGSGILFGLVIFTIIVPSDCIMLAQYASFRNFDLFGIIAAIRGSGFNLIGNPASLYILAASGMGVKSGIYIYFLRQSIKGLPIQIEEAAFVDGAGFLRTFFSIVVPSMSGSILTVSVLSFLWNYTDTYYVGLLNPTTSNLAYNYQTLQSNIRWSIDAAAKTNSEWLNLIDASNPYVQNSAISACAVLVVAPLIILYCFVQKRFVQGAARSGLGGD